MERKKVNSSHIRSVGYEPSSLTLEVETTDGTVWQYTKVPPEVHRRLMAAPTIATYYRDNIEEEYSGKRGIANKQQNRDALEALFKKDDAE